MQNQKLKRAKELRNKKRRVAKKKRGMAVWLSKEIKERKKYRAIREALRKRWTRAMAKTHSDLVLNNELTGFSFKDFFSRIRALTNKQRKSLWSKKIKREKKEAELQKDDKDKRESVRSEAEHTG